MSIIPTLYLKQTYNQNYEINIKKENINKLPNVQDCLMKY